MEKNWKIIVPIAIVGLVAIAIIMSMRDQVEEAPVVPQVVEQEQQSVVVAPESNTPATPPSASVSGEVDDMVSVLLNEAGGDEALVSGVAESATAVKNDTQEVNSLTTMYDETAF